jgi:hypothetical protein
MSFAIASVDTALTILQQAYGKGVGVLVQAPQTALDRLAAALSAQTTPPHLFARLVTDPVGGLPCLQPDGATVHWFTPTQDGPPPVLVFDELEHAPTRCISVLYDLVCARRLYLSPLHPGTNLVLLCAHDSMLDVHLAAHTIIGKRLIHLHILEDVDA